MRTRKMGEGVAEHYNGRLGGEESCTGKKGTLSKGIEQKSPELKKRMNGEAHRSG